MLLLGLALGRVGRLVLLAGLFVACSRGVFGAPLGGDVLVVVGFGAVCWLLGWSLLGRR